MRKDGSLNVVFEKLRGFQNSPLQAALFLIPHGDRYMTPSVCLRDEIFGPRLDPNY